MDAIEVRSAPDALVLILETMAIAADQPGGPAAPRCWFDAVLGEWFVEYSSSQGTFRSPGRIRLGDAIRDCREAERLNLTYRG